MTFSNERQGELLAISAYLIWAIFPVLVKMSENIFPPLFFSSASFLIGGIFALVILLIAKKTKELINKKAVIYMLLNTLFIVLLFFPLIFFAGQKTSAGNTGILITSEIIFTLLFFGFLKLEKVTKNNAIGALLMFFGALLVLSNNFSGQINIYDLIIILACILSPLGNFYGKKALKIISPTTIVCFRNLVGGAILLLTSLFLEKIEFSNLLSNKGISIILVNGILIAGIRIILSFMAIKKIDVHKLIALSGISPAITLLFAFIFLKEFPQNFQIIGVIFVFAGTLFLTKTSKQSQF